MHHQAGMLGTNPAIPQVTLERLAFEFLRCVIHPHEEAAPPEHWPISGRNLDAKNRLVADDFDFYADDWRDRRRVVMQPVADVIHQPIKVFEESYVTLQADSPTSPVLDSH